MNPYLLQSIPEKLAALAVEGTHKPGSLTQASGAWIHAAGAFVLEKGEYPLNPHDQWVWCFLPGGSATASISTDKQTRCLWIALEGPLSPMVVRKMGALLHMPLKQGALPSQIYLAEQIVQVIVRHTGTADATYQLQHLMYGMIASHWGQPVAMDAMLSHEIAKVVDTLRANQYRDNYSLADMAAISRMPMETFRKRFVAEVGMPPLSYVLHCKMERAKELLRDQNWSVRQAGAAVGMQDPYHFSKQFKHIVGISPRLHEAGVRAVRHDPRRDRKNEKEVNRQAI